MNYASGKKYAIIKAERNVIDLRNTSLCYIEHNGCYLMLHRTKKAVDENSGKWIGVGGGFEEGESPEDCCIREVREETGISLSFSDLSFRGVITFVSDEWGTEYMHLFTASLPEDCNENAESFLCSEGVLKWIPKNEVTSLPIWEGDRVFLQLLAQNEPFFSLKLVYRGDELVEKKRY